MCAILAVAPTRSPGQFISNTFWQDDLCVMAIACALGTTFALNPTQMGKRIRIKRNGFLCKRTRNRYDTVSPVTTEQQAGTVERLTAPGTVCERPFRKES